MVRKQLEVEVTQASGLIRVDVVHEWDDVWISWKGELRLVTVEEITETGITFYVKDKGHHVLDKDVKWRVPD